MFLLGIFVGWLIATAICGSMVTRAYRMALDASQEHIRFTERLITDASVSMRQLGGDCDQT
jgi:hypothetical protein